MHPNQIYRDAGEARNLAFARARAFGALTVNGPEGPLLSHVPFVFEAAEAGAAGGAVLFHLMRSNPIARSLGTPAPALLAVAGPDSYVSPDWYGVPDQVPTWNYVAVHLRGALERLPDSQLGDVLAAQSAAFEARLAPKPPWTMEKLSAETRDRLMRMIVPCRLRLSGVDGTWKLSQNKSEEAREGAGRGIGAAGFGIGCDQLAALMAEAWTAR